MLMDDCSLKMNTNDAMLNWRRRTKSWDWRICDFSQLLWRREMLELLSCRTQKPTWNNSCCHWMHSAGQISF